MRRPRRRFINGQNCPSHTIGCSPALPHTFVVFLLYSVKHRPVWLRALLTLWGVWFATALAAPAGLMACPMHGGIPVAASSEGGGASVGDNSTAAHEHHVDTAPVEASSHIAQPLSTDAPAQEHSHQCSCLGQCCAMAIDALGAHEEPLPAVARVSVPQVARPTMVTHFATLIKYGRPFANGPPTVVS